MVTWNNLDTLASFQNLSKTGRIDLEKSNVWRERGRACEKLQYPNGRGIAYNYAAKQVDDDVLEALVKLAEEAQLSEKFEELYNGAVINTGENRLVLHQLTRGQLGKLLWQMVWTSVNSMWSSSRELLISQIRYMPVRLQTLLVRNSQQLSRSVSVEVTLVRVLCILALENWAKKNNTFKMEAKFISNVDPDDAAAVLNSVDVAHSIFVLVSKSGTTLETLTNESFVKDALKNAGLDASKHMIAVTSETSPLAKSDDYLAAFFMDDYIGGRYSSTSAVGGAVLSLAFGPDVFAQFLDGAAAEDKLSQKKMY